MTHGPVTGRDVMRDWKDWLALIITVIVFPLIFLIMAQIKDVDAKREKDSIDIRADQNKIAVDLRSEMNVSTTTLRRETQDIVNKIDEKLNKLQSSQQDIILQIKQGQVDAMKNLLDELRQKKDLKTGDL